MTCAASFKDGRQTESMDDHIRVGLDYLKKRYLERHYGKYLSSILGLEKADAERLLKLSYILHDIGKGLKHYQERKQSFRFHEFYSAVISYTLLEPQFGEAGTVAATAVLLHHHDWIRKDEPVEFPRLVLDQCCIDVFKKWTHLNIPSKVSMVDTLVLTDLHRKRLRAVYAFLLPIVQADNYAAYKNRGDISTPSKLGKEVLESGEFYGVR